MEIEKKETNQVVIPGTAGNQESSRFAFCRHPEFISGSSRFNGKDKMLKQVQHDVVGVRAFTLIELLVVVLIIGILAAVAVPQYQKAVIRTRFAALKPMTHALAAAQERYYLANGEYAANIADLDINLPDEKDETKSTEDTYYYDWGYCGISSSLAKCGNSSIRMQYQVFLQYNEGKTKAPNKRCIVFGSQDLTDMRNQVCKAEAAGAETGDINGTYTRWTFQ